MKSTDKYTWDLYDEAVAAIESAYEKANTLFDRLDAVAPHIEMTSAWEDITWRLEGLADKIKVREDVDSEQLEAIE